MNEDELKQLVETTYEHRNVTINQTDNGYALVGHRRFLSRNMGVLTATLERTAIATTMEAALSVAGNFIATGDFRGTFSPEVGI